MSERSARIGMIVPSSNTCLEPQTYRILGDRGDVTEHFARVEVTRITLNDAASNQFDHSTQVEAAQLLHTAEVDVVVWNGAAGSWLGPAYDRTMVEHLTESTAVPATTSTLAYFEAFEQSSLSRVGLIAPHTGEAPPDLSPISAAVPSACSDEQGCGG